ncbi:MAG: hypothetical protein ABR985_12060 [Methanotrichaceae archaeon]|jgi:stress-induced morphogen
MHKNKNPKTRGVSIKSPEDVRRIACRIISDVFREKAQIEQAGKVNNLLTTWLKAFELEKVSDFEARLKALEQAREDGK